MVLDIRDTTLDDDSKLLDRKGYGEQARSGKANHVKITVIDHDLGYRRRVISK